MNTVQTERASSEGRLAAQAAPWAAPGFRAWISESRAQLGIVSAAVIGMFVPVVIVPYAFSDDYTDLWMATSRESTGQFGENLLTASAITGRALAGLLDDLFLTTAGTVENLRFVRVFAVLGIVALALLLHWALVRARIKPTVAALIAVFICSLPPFQVYASWTILFNSPYAAVLAGGASLVAVAALDGPRDLLLDRLVGATVLLVAALQVYQPGAMYFWVFLAIGLVGAREDPERAWRLTKIHLALGLLALAVSYVIIKVQCLLSRGDVDRSRSQRARARSAGQGAVVRQGAALPLPESRPARPVGTPGGSDCSTGSGGDRLLARRPCPASVALRRSRTAPGPALLSPESRRC